MSTPTYRSLKAKEAGVYLSSLLGLPASISAQSMWRLARLKEIPHKRIARQILFRTDWLEYYAGRDDAGFLQQSYSEGRKDGESL
jgi:hypothetical protein